MCEDNDTSYLVKEQVKQTSYFAKPRKKK